MQIDWQNIEDIAIELFDAYPDIDPLTVRFTDLLDKIVKIPSFVGTRGAVNEARLEAIQMAWYEEWKDNL